MSNFEVLIEQPSNSMKRLFIYTQNPYYSEMNNILLKKYTVKKNRDEYYYPHLQQFVTIPHK